MQGDKKNINFDCMVRKEFTNTAASITTMNSVPNVSPRLRSSGRSCAEEDIVD
jgi:hypothetical protein